MFGSASLIALIALCVTTPNVVANSAPSPVLHARTPAATVINPLVSQFPVGATITVSAQADASFDFQRVTFNDGTGSICIIQGNGESEQMVTSTSPVGATSCTFVGTTSSIPVTLSMLFQFSTSGVSGGSFSNAVILTPTVAEDGSTLDIVTIDSEDNTDNNGNNTIVTIAILDPSGLSSSISTATSSEGLTSRSGILVSNDGIDISIGNFAGNSTTTDFVANTSAWGRDGHECRVFTSTRRYTRTRNPS